VVTDNVYDPNWQAPPGVQRFKLSELSNATGGFDKSHEIGIGGFGKVFVGNFKDGRTLAIKRASGLVSSNQGLAEFRNEVLFIFIYLFSFACHVCIKMFPVNFIAILLVEIMSLAGTDH